MELRVVAGLGADVSAGRTLDFETQGCTWSVVYRSWLEGDAYASELTVR